MVTATDFTYAAWLRPPGGRQTGAVAPRNLEPHLSLRRVQQILCQRLPKPLGPSTTPDGCSPL